MREAIKKVHAVLLIILFAAVIPALSQRRVARVSDREVDNLLRRIESRSDVFQTSLTDALNRSPIDGSRREDNINQFVQDFEAATDRLAGQFRSRRETAADVQEVLSRAVYIDGFMQRRNLAGRAENDWNMLRADLNTLASYYNVNWRWEQPVGNGERPGGNRGRPSGNNAACLTGTYQLNVSRSDRVEEAAENATRNLEVANRDRIRQNLERRLQAPTMLALDRQGRSVTIASTAARQVTVEASGQTQTEQTRNGRTIQTKATLMGDQLEISTTGDRANDFTVTFDPMDNCRTLRVTRRIYNERLAQAVTVQSFYEKTSEVAQLDILNDRDSAPAGRVSPRGNYTITDGTQLSAVLNTDISTKTAREGDRFTMTVRSPGRYDGAVIEGFVTKVERSGRVAGRADLVLDFDRIRLRDGQTYDFAGSIESVRSVNGETVRVDNEGGVSDDDSQTGRTVARSGIGAAIGAVIGAIAGGGKGAAIGAVVGAGAGAGSIFIEGREDVELLRGTEMTIRAAAPRNT